MPPDLPETADIEKKGSPKSTKTVGPFLHLFCWQSLLFHLVEWACAQVFRIRQTCKISQSMLCLALEVSMSRSNRRENHIKKQSTFKTHYREHPANGTCPEYYLLIPAAPRAIT